MPNFTIKHTPRILLDSVVDQSISPGGIYTLNTVDNSIDLNTMFLLEVRTSNIATSSTFLEVYISSVDDVSGPLHWSAPPVLIISLSPSENNRHMHFTYGPGMFAVSFVTEFGSPTVSLSSKLFAYNPHSTQDA